jgi:hypothetical protein
VLAPIESKKRLTILARDYTRFFGSKQSGPEGGAHDALWKNDESRDKAIGRNKVHVPGISMMHGATFWR